MLLQIIVIMIEKIIFIVLQSDSIKGVFLTNYLNSYSYRTLNNNFNIYPKFNLFILQILI